jgi:hypothetical protein
MMTLDTFGTGLDEKNVVGVLGNFPSQVQVVPVAGGQAAVSGY